MDRSISRGGSLKDGWVSRAATQGTGMVSTRTPPPESPLNLLRILNLLAETRDRGTVSTQAENGYAITARGGIQEGDEV